MYVPHKIISIALSIIGITISFYLISSRLRKKPVICPVKQNCNIVLDSKYNKLFYIKNDVLGLIYYVTILISTIYFQFIQNNASLFIIFSGIALSVSIILVFIQVKLIKGYCFYCILSSLVNLSIFLVMLDLR